MTGLILDAAAKGTVVLLAAWIVTGLLRRAAADFRHRAWLAALVAMPLFLIPIPVPEAVRMVISVPPSAANVALSSTDWAGLAAGLWAAGTSLILARFGIGLARLVWLSRTAQAPGAEFVVVGNTAATMPMTWGVVRPVILLPEYVMDWPAEKRELVIRHEQAHVRRKDWLWQTLAQLISAVFWFHPLVWLALLRLRDEAECAADDIVLSAGADPAEYAQQLLEVVRNLRGRVSLQAVAMVRRTVLNARIVAILDSRRVRGCAGVRTRTSLIAVSAVLVVLLAACQSARVYRVAEVTTPPRVVSKVEPNYTQAARDAKIVGTVVLALVVNPQGRAENIRVVKRVGAGLDQNAVDAIEQWQFSPGMKNGKPVRVAATIEVNFKLL